jgi:hypothetical protein
MPCRRLFLAGLCGLVGLILAAPAAAVVAAPEVSEEPTITATASPHSHRSHEHPRAESRASRSRAGTTAPRTPPSLSDQTGLVLTIDRLSPATLGPGERVEMSGTLTNGADYAWYDAQAYLEMSTAPATSKGEVDDFGVAGDAKFGKTVVDFGYFGEVGDLQPGESTRYDLSVPYRLLPAATDAAGAPGVYRIGVSVIATPDGVDRDINADARTATLLPLVSAASPPPKPTEITTLVPITAPVARQPDGAFVNDSLARQVSTGGRLDNLLDFVGSAPPGSIELVVDPALLDAVRAMSDGYQVQSLGEAKEGIEPREGRGQADALAWLNSFRGISVRQQVSLMPWANPDSSALVEAGQPGVVAAAVRASRRFASTDQLGNAVIDWQDNGASTRRGLAAARNAGVTDHVVSQATLTRLHPEDDNGYPPSLASVTTRQGPLYTVVTRSELAGEPLDAHTTGVEFRQGLLAEATIRAFSSTKAPTSVVALPFHWNPGAGSATLDLAGAFTSPAMTPVSLSTVTSAVAQPYAGPVEITTNAPGFSSGQLAAITRLHKAGRIYTELLTDGRQTAMNFDEQLATSGASAWQWRPKRGEALTRRTARAMSDRIAQVTVTGPEFVALSSESGRFPLTVANGLDVSVTVGLDVTSANPAIRFDAIDTMVLGAGERRDVEVRSKASGSGVTVVKARLATSTDRSFGKPWDFDVRATKIGLAIWILIGILGAALFSGAAIRIVQRFRGGGFTPRGEVP